MRQALLLLLAFVVTGCANKSIYTDPTNDADKMLFFVERDRRAGEHIISAEIVAVKENDVDGENVANRVPTRIPNPAYVDVDSLIQIKVSPPPGLSARPLFGRESEKLLETKERVLALMQALDAVVASRQNALGAYRDGNPTDDFDGLANDSAKLTEKFVESFTEVYPRGSPGYRAANEAIGGGGIQMLKPVLQDEIDEIEAEDKRIKEKATNRGATLSLEAFLDAPGDELTALHLRGYDNLAEGRVARRDRQGLNLSDEDRAELSEQIRMTEDIASTLDSIRTNERSLQEGVFESLRIVSPDLATQIAAAEDVARRLADSNRRQNVKRDLGELVNEANSRVSTLTGGTRASLSGLPAEFEDQSDKLQQALQSVVGAIDINRSWEQLQQSRNLDALPDLLSKMQSLGQSIQITFDTDKLPEWLAQGEDIATAILKRESRNVDDDARQALSAFLNSDAVSSTVSNIESYYADVQEGIAIVREVGRILGIGNVEVARIAPDVPEAFDVSIEQLQDTLLDLRRVPGNDGDTILIRARLKKPGLDPIESVATFELTHYGYYARLVPSVVLVRPDEIASGNDDFRFAPALGWMHHYRPRPEDDGWFATFARPLQLAGGLHAIFLNFDNESGIGLGGTLSFWNDRLQFGAGYNLSASSSDEGRLYFFVGSDLIGLLQAVGIGN